MLNVYEREGGLLNLEYQTNELAHQDKQHDRRQSKLQIKGISEQKQTKVKQPCSYK